MAAERAGHFATIRFSMMTTEQDLRREIVEVGRMVWQKGWVAANDGNISVRMGQNRILCTPTGVSKGLMRDEDMIVVDMQGRKIEGRKEGTTEIAMHLAIYNLRPDVKAVVHAHPPVATGFAAAGRALNLALLPEVIIGLGCVPLVDYGLPGTQELIEPMLPMIPKFDALMMGNHGAVCYGEDLRRAYFRMETVEHFARITLVAELLGGPKLLPRDEVQKLVDARARYGVRSRSADTTCCPVAAEEAGVQSERFEVTRDELIALVEEALRARGPVQS
jgi:L-fuculose-phosphate aldolase